MAIQYVVPSAGYLNETATIQYAMPSMHGRAVFVNGTGSVVTPPVTFDATRMFLIFP